MNVYEIEQIVEGVISDIRPYGAIITFPDGKHGLLHIKQISDSYISNINTYLHVNSNIKVRILEIDETNSFMKLSLKSVPQNERVQFTKNKGEGSINPNQLNFTALEEALPEWIAIAIKEIEND